MINMKIVYRNQIYNQGSTTQTNVGNNKQSINPVMPKGNSNCQNSEQTTSTRPLCISIISC